jgi:hypothetical protein
MRILSLVFSSLLALLVTVLALAYLPGYFGRERIYLEDRPEVAKAIEGSRTQWAIRPVDHP